MSNPANGNPENIWVRVLGGGGSGTNELGQWVFPATINVADPVALTDGQISTLSIDSAGRLRCLITPAANAVFTTAPQGFQSVAARATVVAPGAGGAVVTIAAGSLPAGTYDVDVNAIFDVGAPVAADTNNMEFRRGAAVITSLQLLPVITNIGIMRRFRMIMDGATALSVNATAAGTAGVGYNASIIATRVA